ncbi:hypothetical protein LCGC14_2051710 [marine sediment metagenome]|uniref:Uncharacterized protein n=1 Tax=marine sediment metagenome TaxID=412755 RepID=A0A0F9FBA9_9ZZZZ
MKLNEVKYAGINLQNAWFVVDLEDGDLIIGPFPKRRDARDYAMSMKKKYSNRQELRFSWTKVVSPEYYDDLLSYDS